MGSTTSRHSIADALFTRSQQRVLAVLFGHPERSFYAKELMRLAAGGSGAVQRELHALEQCGLVTARRQGNQRHYQANAQSPVYDELRAIVTKTFGVADMVRAALAPLAARVTMALIYGSMAKGSSRAASDVDLMIVSDDVTLEELYVALAPVEQGIGRRVNPTLYTREEFARRRRSGSSFLSKVLAGPTIPLIGLPDAHP